MAFKPSKYFSGFPDGLLNDALEAERAKFYAAAPPVAWSGGGSSIIMASPGSSTDV